jgi:hypothetical protein
MNWNSGFSVGALPGAGGVADNLIKNPFGGYGGLNVGGFGGNVPSYGGAASGASSAFSPGLGFLTAANSVMAGAQQANLNTAAQNQFAAQNAMFDAGFGKEFLAQNFDRFRSFNDPIRAAQIAVNQPDYRRSLTRANLPDLAGKYGSFGAYVYS